MKRSFWFILVALGALLPAAPAKAILPLISIWADQGLRGPLELELWQDAQGRFHLDDYSYTTSEFSIRVHDVLMDPDPSISYAIGVTDFGAPSSFTFLLSTPILPTGSPNLVNSSIAGGLTDQGGNGVSLTPQGATVQESSVGVPLTSLGVGVGSAFAAGAGSAGANYVYGPDALGPVAGPGPGAWTILQTSVAFTLSGDGDLAALTGYTSIVEGAITPVPEAASGVLLGLGLLGAGLAAIRRRRAA